VKLTKITVKGSDKLEVFFELVELLRNPKMKTELVVDEKKAFARIRDPEKVIEIETE